MNNSEVARRVYDGVRRSLHKKRYVLNSRTFSKLNVLLRQDSRRPLVKFDMDAIGCLLIVFGLCCAGVLAWLFAAGVLVLIIDGVLRHPLSIDAAITAALVLGAAVCLPVGIKIIRRGLPP